MFLGRLHLAEILVGLRRVGTHCIKLGDPLETRLVRSVHHLLLCALLLVLMVVGVEEKCLDGRPFMSSRVELARPQCTSHTRAGNE
jgi:hypothetical protein